MRGHFITAGAAATAGLVAGLVAAGSPEVSAASLERSVEPAAVVLSAGATATVDSFALANLCPEIETAAGLGGGDCAAADINHIWLNRVDYDDDDDDQTPTVKRWAASPRASFGGTWSKNP